MAEIKSKKERLFEDYLSKSLVYVVDTSAVSRSRLMRSLKELGAKDNLIKGFSKYEEALKNMEEEKPKIVLTEYKLRNRSGFDLLRTHREQHGNSRDCLFILITSNSSQSLVAKAAEEDIDSFILKPYTVDTLRNTLINTALEKLYPSPYVKAIEEGKELLFSGKPDESIGKFEHAKTLHPKPSLACFYAGQAEYMAKSMAEAEGKYKEGLAHNKIHYKCLVSLFDLFYEMKKYDDAYDVVKIISQYFPANPDRLSTVLRLAVMTNNFKDIEAYYNIFITLDMRTPELVTYVCAGLVVCGKFLFQNNEPEKALQIFEKVGITAFDTPKFLRIAVENLIQHGYIDEATKFLLRFDAEIQTDPDYILSKFLVESHSMKPAEAIGEGKKLLKQGVENYCLHYILISKYLEDQNLDDAKVLLEQAMKKWPEKISVYWNLKEKMKGLSTVEKAV